MDRGRKDVFVEDDEIFDQLIDKVLILHLVSVFWDWYEGGTKANGKIVRIHHIFITENKITCQHSNKVGDSFQRYLNSDKWFRNAKRYLTTMKTGLGQDSTTSFTLNTNSCFDSNSEKAKKSKVSSARK